MVLATGRRRVHDPSVRFLSFIFLLCAVITSSPERASTQPDAQAILARFEGTFDNPAPDDGAAAIERAITEGIADMNAMRRLIAQRRLVENNPPIPSVSVSREGRRIIVDYARGRRHTTPGLGRWVPSRAPDGGRVEVSHRVDDGRLVQAFRERNGGAEHVFSLSEDGARLEMTATITSPHIPRPISYALTLDRAR